MKILKWLLPALLLCLPLFSAQAEALPEGVQALVPADAEITGEQSVSHYRVLALALETGEQLELTWNAQSEKPISLITIAPAGVFSEAPVSREAAETIALAAYPGAGVLFSRDGEGGEKILCLLSETLSGEISVAGEAIVSRSLTCGAYARDGMLTMEGALAALSLHRPEADFRALELDEDDGALYYEGEARVDGVVYEFELNARTGMLVEWERD